MNLTPRAARQLRALEPDRAARILDHLRDDPATPSTSIVEVTVDGDIFRAFVSHHRDGSRVLLGVVAHRSEMFR